LSKQSSVAFDSEQQLFTITLAKSFYALRILADGQVIHVASGASESPVSLSDLDGYEDKNYIFDYQCRQWEVPAFGDISYHTAPLKVSFLQAPKAITESESANLPVRDLRLRYSSHEVHTGAEPGFSPALGIKHVKGGVKRETLVVKMRDTDYDFWLTLYYRITPEHDVIERWIEIENKTSYPVQVDALAFGTINLPPASYELTRAAGAWAREFTPLRRPLEQGETIIRQFGLNTGHASNPFYFLNEVGRATENAGSVHFGALAYSGNWSLNFDALLTGAVRIHGGYEPDGFDLTLQPGEKHTTPAFIHGVADDGLGGASRRLHSFARDYVLPEFGQDRYRPVLYNSWEASYFDLSNANQTALAHLAAEIGIEMFCVDDGWFGGRRHDKAGLGDWNVSDDVFPEGLAPLISEVRRLGMKFGLWVEPEMINPDSDLYRAHPDWVLHYPGRPRTEVRNQLILDFGRVDVVEHILNALDSLLQEYKIDFFKWDMNRYATEPGSVAGSNVWMKHVEGLYHIVDTLRLRHPGLEIESCSGGAGRVDYGILGRVDQFWTSDNTDAYDRVTIQDGCSLAYPSRAMMCWVTHERNHQTGRVASLDLRFDVAMRGSLGIGSSLHELKPEELDEYKRKIAFYKSIRPIVQAGDLYRLATTYDTGKVRHSVWQYVSEDKKRSVYSCVVTDQMLGHYLPPHPLRGLDSLAVYAASDHKGQRMGHYSGSQLMTLGLPGETVTGGLNTVVRSRTVLLETDAS
jgi:alpha-galactosidase